MLIMRWDPFNSDIVGNGTPASCFPGSLGAEESQKHIFSDNILILVMGAYVTAKKPPA